MSVVFVVISSFFFFCCCCFISYIFACYVITSFSHSLSVYVYVCSFQIESLGKHFPPRFVKASVFSHLSAESYTIAGANLIARTITGKNGEKQNWASSRFLENLFFVFLQTRIPLFLFFYRSCRNVSVKTGSMLQVVVVVVVMANCSKKCQHRLRSFRFDCFVCLALLCNSQHSTRNWGDLWFGDV